MATEVCPKGRKHIGGGEAPVYGKYQIHSPNGAAEIEESLWPEHIHFYAYMPKTVSVLKFIGILNKYGIEYDEKYIWK